MFGLPPQTLFIIGAIAVLAITMVPKTFWLSLVPKVQSESGGITIPLRPGSEADKSAKAPDQYLAVQKMLLEARTACGDCPEATAAIDAAIKATVAMVVK